ncbi:MAG TPA: DUF2459 domain-containing protein [Hyphomicrobiales bacterium]|nr:DUF2459 domain-containing protein [Hyphomicrobiales bacterium]
MPHARFLCLLMFLLLGGCASSLPQTAVLDPGEPASTIWLVYRDWHTSLLIDGEEFRQYSRQLQHDPRLARELAPALVVRVGWGDGDYFTGKSKTAGTATRALFASRHSAMQFIGYERDPLAVIPEDTRVSLRVSREGLAALVAYIDASLATNDGAALRYMPAYVENAGVFFESSKAYGLFNNCNTWTGEALSTAGLPVRSAFRLTPRSIFEQAQGIAAQQQLAQAAVAGP